MWRVSLFIIAYLAQIFIPNWGGRFPYADRELEITGLPSWIWGFGNFDGVHYLRIAQNGYNFLASQAFFPLYPLIIRFFSTVIPKNPFLDTQVFVDPAFFYSGMLISNLFFVFGLYFFYKLIENDFNKKVAFWSVIFLLAFPTSFYFGSIYTEGTFLFFVSSCLYFLRKEKYILAAVLAALASATRLVGIFLFFSIVIEILKRYKDVKIGYIKLIKILTAVLIAPLGTVIYMLFLQIRFGNAFLFLSVQPIFGTGRSSQSIVVLPQVLFRYAKMLVKIHYLNQGNIIIFLEFAMTTILLVVLICSFKRIRTSYWLFSLVALLLPTVTGTLSSMPRFILSGFLLFPFVVKNLKMRYLYFTIVVLIILHIILLSMFIRGYWVA